MRALMGLIKDRHGTYCAQQKVPEKPKGLQAAVARLLGKGKPRQAFLKKSLGTKDLREANVRAKPVLAGFDQIMRQARALLAEGIREPLLRESLNPTEIARIAEHVYGTTLAWDERFRFGGREELRRTESEVRVLLTEGQELEPLKYPYASLPPQGMSMAQLKDTREQLDADLADMQAALALGNIAMVEHHAVDALEAFGIDLAPDSGSRQPLGVAVLRSYVRALQAIGQRNAGEPVETPKLTQVARVSIGVQN